MKLSIICVTQAAPEVRPILGEIVNVAHLLGAELILGGDGAQALTWADYNRVAAMPVKGAMVEEMIDPVIDATTGDYILRLDDDESCSPGLVNWLKNKEFTRRDSWFFSRYHLWPDENYALADQPYFPDFQVRLAVRRQSKRPVKIHAAHAYNAYRAPALAFLRHHVFLVKTREQRQTVTAHYETIRTGKLFRPEDVNVVLPYDDPKVKVAHVGAPHMLEIATETKWWREPGMRLPHHLAEELRLFRESQHGRGQSQGSVCDPQKGQTIRQPDSKTS